MFHRIRTAGLSVLIALGTLASVPVTAQADSLYFGFGIGAPAQAGWYGDRHRSHRWERHRHYDRAYRSCSPRRAVQKAHRFGIRHARVVDVSRRTIHVMGRKHHRRVGMIFARAPHCPVINWR